MKKKSKIFRNKLLTVLMLLTTFIFYSQKLPEHFNLVTINNEHFTQNNLSTNINVFIFWATWCVPCIEELDAINEKYTEIIETYPIALFAVSTDDMRSFARIKPLVAGKGWHFPVLLDKNETFKRKLQITSIPYLVIVKNNTVVYKKTGYTPGDENLLIAKIKYYTQTN